MMRRRTLISGLLLAGLLAAASMRVPGRAQAPQQPRQVLDLGADPDDVVLGEPVLTLFVSGLSAAGVMG